MKVTIELSSGKRIELTEGEAIELLGQRAQKPKSLLEQINDSGMRQYFESHRWQPTKKGPLEQAIPMCGVAQ